MLYEKIEEQIEKEVTHQFEDTNAFAVMIVLKNGYTSIGTSSDSDGDMGENTRDRARYNAIDKLVKVAELQVSKPIDLPNDDDDDDVKGRIREILATSKN